MYVNERNYFYFRFVIRENQLKLLMNGAQFYFYTLFFFSLLAFHSFDGSESNRTIARFLQYRNKKFDFVIFARFLLY